MIRAFFLAILGARFEVRLINTKSGKNVPGTKLCEGSYLKCRKLVRDKQLKYGQMIRLQAVTVLEWDINSDASTMTIVDEASVTPTDFSVRTPAISNEEKIIISANAPLIHDCNADGAYEYDEATGRYDPTCSICGQMTEAA